MIRRFASIVLGFGGFVGGVVASISEALQTEDGLDNIQTETAEDIMTEGV